MTLFVLKNQDPLSKLGMWRAGGRVEEEWEGRKGSGEKCIVQLKTISKGFKKSSLGTRI